MMSTLMRLRRATIASAEEEEDIVLQASVIEDWLDSLNNELYARVQEVYSEELQQGSLVDLQKVLVEEVEGNLKVCCKNNNSKLVKWVGDQLLGVGEPCHRGIDSTPTS